MRRLVNVTVFVVLVVATVYDLFGSFPAVALLPMFCLAVLLYNTGRLHGIRSVRAEIERVFESGVACIGGPHDGERLPTPLGWDSSTVESVAVIDPAFPEGRYVKDDDRLVWVEDE